MPDYGTVSSFRIYHTARGRDVEVGTYPDVDVEAAKLIASEWLDGRYRGSFPGYKVNGRDQAREWPRYDAFDYEGRSVSSATVPTEVENATYEATYKELVTPGALFKDYTPSKYNKVAISGSVSVEFRNTSAFDLQMQFPVIDQIMQSLIGCSSSSSLSGEVVRV